MATKKQVKNSNVQKVRNVKSKKVSVRSSGTKKAKTNNRTNNKSKHQTANQTRRSLDVVVLPNGSVIIR